ncbi:MAG: hypothetical protein BWY82_00753 [Verrucomicrobia bacterium ADurb.Bin474]|nr:MAG: hypothetical protein BWY82_00753 [Verrucomicrobia bacterium ADurb.Bin474]
MKLLRVLVTPAIAIFLSGCASILMRNECSSGVAPPYIGTREDIKMIRGTEFWTMFWPASAVWGVLDIPFSTAFDTVLLPFDAINWCTVTRPKQKILTFLEQPTRITSLHLAGNRLYMTYDTVVTRTDYWGNSVTIGANTSCWAVADLTNDESLTRRAPVDILASNTCPSTAEALPVSMIGGEYDRNPVRVNVSDGRVLTISGCLIPTGTGWLVFFASIDSQGQTRKTHWRIPGRSWTEPRKPEH